MYEDNRFWDDDCKEENERVYDTWDLVFRCMAKEKRTGKCHTHIYKSILTPEKLLHYCYMNSRIITEIRVCPNYEEAEAMLDFLSGHGYELQYDMADGHLYLYDWNSESDFKERVAYGLEEAALFCRDMADELLEYATNQGDDTKDLEHLFVLFSTWCSRFTHLKSAHSGRG